MSVSNAVFKNEILFTFNSFYCLLKTQLCHRLRSLETVKRQREGKERLFFSRELYWILTHLPRQEDNGL